MTVYSEHVEHDVRRDADHLGGQHQPEELAILRRRCQLRAADGLDAGRARQAHGQPKGDAGAAGGDRDEAPGRGEGARLAPETDRRQFAAGKETELAHSPLCADGHPRYTALSIPPGKRHFQTPTCPFSPQKYPSGPILLRGHPLSPH